MSTEFQPYVGPRPFERNEADQNRFFGREDEASELMSRISAHSAVLFYSQSGAGKTSLINAKLTPLLEDAGFTVLKPVRVRDVPPEDSILEKISNIYAFNVLRSWDQGLTDPNVLARMSVYDFLKDRREIVEKEEDRNPRVAIFDQFEELFTSYQERSGDREDFFDQVGAALDNDRLLRVVFAMREDYIAELDPYTSFLPEKLRTRYRIERLSEDDALLAITEPLKNTEYSYAPGVAEQLVENLLMVPVETAKGVEKVRGESVEPVQLQVVCQTLWENCQNTWRTTSSAKKVITRGFLESFGDVDQALSTFYETSITRVVQATGVKEGILRRWFEQSLITSAGTRGTVFRGRDETGDILNAAIDELVNQHIIRAEIRGGSRWYELTHDRFIAPIKASNKRWLLAHSGGEQTPQRLEARAERWIRDGEKEVDLLDEGELLEARRWLKSDAAADVVPSNELKSLVQASRLAQIEKQAKSTRRLRLLVTALVVLVLLSIGALIFATMKKQEAVNSRRVAEDQAAAAAKAEGEARTQRDIATEQSTLASRRATELEQVNILLNKAITKAKDETTRANSQARVAQTNATNAVQLLAAKSRFEVDIDQAQADYDGITADLAACAQKDALFRLRAKYQILRLRARDLGEVTQQTKISGKINQIDERINATTCIQKNESSR